MIALHPTPCVLFLLVFLISTSRSIASPSQAEPRVSHVRKREAATSRQDCTGVFTWDPKNTADNPICIPVQGVRYACRLSSCTFRGQPLTQQNFVFKDCSWEDPQKRGSYIQGDVQATEMYYIVWDPENYPRWISVVGTHSVNAAGSQVHATCPMTRPNESRPTCSNCWEAPVKPGPY